MQRYARCTLMPQFYCNKRRLGSSDGHQHEAGAFAVITGVARIFRFHVIPPAAPRAFETDDAVGPAIQILDIPPDTAVSQLLAQKTVVGVPRRRCSARRWRPS